jgi:hypothetical protein
MATGRGKNGWVSYAEAQRQAGIGRVALFTLIEQGRLSVRSIPGSKPRVRLDELQSLIEASTRRASTPEAQPCGA